MRQYVKDHDQIMKWLKKELKECECACIEVNGLAKSLGKDVRTIKSHLEIASQHGEGKFIDKKKNTFCTKDGITELYKEISGSVPNNAA